MSTTETKPPITCHVLDTTVGRPAPSIPVLLTLHNPPPSLSSNPLTFSAQTNSDGRVTSWTPTSPFSASSVENVFQSEEGGEQMWSLRFDTEGYFGGRGVDTFFPEVEVRFRIKECQRGLRGGRREHFHVPVLLGPFGYTTYRGS
ncbi:Hydroxyisourate hydrolase [Westerdykella ornata]|uniref:5-hydroxyisourate hydrolase n=1 Tax=Westerdykella ornata TaxID=318751 RepID=A0A6A6J939_WESOR|nr:Hydroxyisourate hydrolase [Westerdykella ornata]KAF2273091.1 Hydroxyisourate hydrolase [Westerdykella ornata]